MDPSSSLNSGTVVGPDEQTELRWLLARRTARLWLIGGPLAGLLAGLLLVNVGFTTEVVPLRDRQGDLLVIQLYGVEIAAEQRGSVSMPPEGTSNSYYLTPAARGHWRLRVSL